MSPLNLILMGAKPNPLPLDDFDPAERKLLTERGWNQAELAFIELNSRKAPAIGETSDGFLPVVLSPDLTAAQIERDKKILAGSPLALSVLNLM